MSNIILSSNENSALLQTLNQSESKVIPSIYSTKEIYAPSSTSWYTITPKTGSATDGQSESWDLPKYGILQSIVLSYTKPLLVLLFSSPPVIFLMSLIVLNISVPPEFYLLYTVRIF
jgi:hypothetical protein